VVPETPTDASEGAGSAATGRTKVTIRRDSSSTSQNSEAIGMSYFREVFKAKGISDRATNVICASWRKSTKKQYLSYIRRWHTYCTRRKISHLCADEKVIVDFLAELFGEGLGYGVINTARSALSTFLDHNGLTVGKLPLIHKFMKDIFKLKPSVPRYKLIWDVNIVLDYLKNWFPLKELCLKMLTSKLVTLIALVTAQRVQTIHLLDINKMYVSENSYDFVIADNVKQSRIGCSNPIISLKAYAPCKSLCVHHTLTEYLRRTENLRLNESKLFISFNKPHRAIGRDSVSRWIKQVMFEAGIDTQMFKAHSTRAAATSAARNKCVPMKEILATAGWSNSKTFAKYYDKPIINENMFANTLLK